MYENIMKPDALILREFILSALEPKLVRLQIAKSSLGDDFNLFEEGLFDSLEFVGLITEIEQTYGIEVDFENFDPAEFATLSRLIRVLQKQSG